MKTKKQLLRRLFRKAHNSPHYFVPQTQLFNLTVGQKYLIKYTEYGKQIRDDNGIERIVIPIPCEIAGKVVFRRKYFFIKIRRL